MYTVKVASHKQIVVRSCRRDLFGRLKWLLVHKIDGSFRPQVVDRLDGRQPNGVGAGHFFVEIFLVGRLLDGRRFGDKCVVERCSVRTAMPTNTGFENIEKH